MHGTIQRGLCRWALVAAASIALLLAACGGGGSGPTTGATPPTTARAATAVYFTDDFSTDYDAVWLSISRVTVVSPAAETELAAYSPAKLVNLPTLRRAGALVAAATIPAEATAVRIYVGTQAKLQKPDGTLMDVALAAPSGYLEFKLEGWNASTGVLALDFDLPRFQLQGNTLTPATRVATSNDYAGWNHRGTEIEGTVVQFSATSLVLDTRTMGRRTITLDGNTTFVSTRSGTWTPAVGDAVEVKASVAGQGADALQLTALVVEDHSAAASSGAVKVEGVVTAVIGSVVTASIDHSENSTALGTLNFDIAGATFKRGNVASVSVGVRIEAYLTQSGTAWTAKIVEIEGAAKSGGESRLHDYAELQGRITSVAGTTVVVQVIHQEHTPGVTAGASVTIDVAGARFDSGAASCMAAGLPIEIKGSVSTAGVLQPVEVSVGGACAAAYPALDGGQSGHQDAPTTSGSIDTEGSITALRSGEFDITVFDLDEKALAATSLTVRYNSSTLFQGVTPATLAVGGFVEVKGDLSNGILTATKVQLR
jgi:hypothetical protein